MADVGEEANEDARSMVKRIDERLEVGRVNKPVVVVALWVAALWVVVLRAAVVVVVRAGGGAHTLTPA